MNDNQSRGGYMPVEQVARIGRSAFALDQPGTAPRDVPDAEVGAYSALRDQYDRALQVAGVVPAAPQRSSTDIGGYERELLQALAPHTVQFARFDCASIPDEHLERYRTAIVGQAMSAPHREGVLREIKSVDSSGRTISEFAGPKTWMRPYQRDPQIGVFVRPADPRTGAPATPMRIPG